MRTINVGVHASRIADESRARPADVRGRGMSTMHVDVPVSRFADESTALDGLMSGGAA
ncbi:hypothetical protein P9239_13440 [Caballeronia sp. LZ062]|uniref:hypothetical protein n=1 Tax=unclassified Caballeronia TaxID=2646786 RepID=UPI00286000EC|nr:MULTISPECIES: hypothetical protein [unclassified Caballeronia]MDR5854122.1 hypothetical protein [Caballeronia sp. LZ050]MDR5871347.1 hypothetical protein [Caballeronia sp. LZ062]